MLDSETLESSDLAKGVAEDKKEEEEKKCEGSEERVAQPCTDWTPGNNYILSLCPPVTESELSRHIYIVNGKTDPTVSELHKY